MYMSATQNVSYCDILLQCIQYKRSNKTLNNFHRWPDTLFARKILTMLVAERDCPHFDTKIG